VRAWYGKIQGYRHISLVGRGSEGDISIVGHAKMMQIIVKGLTK